MTHKDEQIFMLKIKKIGNTHFLEIPQAILNRMGLGVGSKIDVRVRDGQLILQRARKSRYS